MTPTGARFDPWRCPVCRHLYPVPSLARDCETRHQNPVEEP